MGGWKKRLADMVADRKSRSYSYADAAGILERLGFELASKGTSHRKWRRRMPDGNDPNKTRLVVIGLVEAGSGTMKPEYLKQMIDTLEQEGLLPGDER